MRRAAAVILAIAAALTVVAGAGRAEAQISYDVEGQQGDNGWYVSGVVLTWQVATGYIPTPESDCSTGVTVITLTGDTPGKEQTCEVKIAGVKVVLTIRIDRTAPTGVTASPARPPDANGWYRLPVAIQWGGSDATSGIAACTSTTYSGPDGESATASGTCRDRAGNVSAPASFGLKYDATAPQIHSMTPERPPDHAGWFLQPVNYTLQASDAVSGVDACPPVSYAGPDDGTAMVTGTCTDRAGNVATATVPLRYDATAPEFAELGSTRTRSAVTLRWAASADTATVTVRRAPDGEQARTFAGASGSITDTGLVDGVSYTYEVTATDAAGNATTRTIDATRPSALLAPALGASLHEPPLLRWRRVKNARYYNVQLFAGRRKILSAWPTRNRLQLKRHWRYRGVRRVLRSGTTYKWYVWPGIGKRSRHRYGRLLGQGQFSMR